MGVTIAGDVAMSVQHSLIHRTTTGVVHVANAISRSESALVHELMQLAIHHGNGKGGGSGGGECGMAVGGLFAFDTKGPPFVGSPDQVHQAAPLQDHCLQALLARTRVPRIFFPALTRVREDHSSFSR
jgi:hypothetical protein